jgi:hypothetical protein
MESLQKITERHPIKLLEQPSEDLALPNNEISIYKGELTLNNIAQCTARIKKSFPALPVGFYEVFAERIKANGFTDDRLQDAVANVIDTCPYPTPTIANFISFDKTIKIYHYHQMIKMADELGKEIWNSYMPVKFPDRAKLVWVHVDDIKKYHFESLLINAEK